MREVKTYVQPFISASTWVGVRSVKEKEREREKEAAVA